MGLLAFALSAAILAQATAAIEQDRAGNRIEPFEAAADTSAEHCTTDRIWCARISAEGGSLEIFDGTQAESERVTARHLLPASDSGDETFAIWPRIVRMPAAGAALTPRQTVFIGIETRQSTMYSGGGASATRLTLLRVEDTPGSLSRIAEILELPIRGSAMIRACFSEEDMARRAGACHDEYSFDATLSLVSETDGAPVFTYSTQATSYPGNVSRYADSLERPPLTQRDLVRMTNETCTYRRLVRFNPVTGRYEFDRPGPDCSEYTSP